MITGFLLGVLSISLLHKGFVVYNNSEKRYLKRPVLSDEAIDSFIKGLKKVNYVKKFRGEQEDLQIKMIMNSCLFKKYRVTYDQINKITNLFKYISSTEKIREYFHYSALMSIEALNVEQSIAEREIQKLLEE